MYRLLAYGLLTIGLLMLLSPPSARTAWCFQCEKTVADLPCPEIPEFCYAGAGVDCYTQNLYIGHTIVRSEVGCLPDCKTESLPNSFMWHEVICCYHDYCNE
ncbi:prostate and testis expressed protein 4-like [Sphaerodactylus townsendi]|uniref:prostate and testis expressed protein 4-like n=1 Tax=Sphaerodactylus townsendi TaxID=933632 RepID=UPI0020260862|nr:prostate and testis expressed protein 4-like [Sphaerodactylus townsendi]